jgi:hypothetical protein
MYKSDIHACIRVEDTRLHGITEPIYECRACSFIGSLAEAVAHAVKNQFDARTSK